MAKKAKPGIFNHASIKSVHYFFFTWESFQSVSVSRYCKLRPRPHRSRDWRVMMWQWLYFHVYSVTGCCCCWQLPGNCLFPGHSGLERCQWPPWQPQVFRKKICIDWLVGMWLLAAKYMVLHQKPPCDCMDHSTLPQSHIEHHSLTSLIYCAVASLPVSFEDEMPEKSKRNRTT